MINFLFAYTFFHTTRNSSSQ